MRLVRISRRPSWSHTTQSCVHFLLERTEFLDWANGEKRPFTSTLSITCSTLPACKIYWPHVRALHAERVRRFGRRGRGPLLCAHTLRLFVYDLLALPGPSGVQGHTADGMIAILEVQAKILITVLGMTLNKASCIFNGGKADGARASR